MATDQCTAPTLMVMTAPLQSLKSELGKFWNRFMYITLRTLVHNVLVSITSGAWRDKDSSKCLWQN